MEKKMPKEVVECFASHMPANACNTDVCNYIPVCCKIADALDVIPNEEYKEVSNDSTDEV